MREFLEYLISSRLRWLLAAAVVFTAMSVSAPQPAQANAMLDLIAATAEYLKVIPGNDRDRMVQGPPVESGYVANATCLSCQAFSAVSRVLETLVPDMVKTMADSARPFVAPFAVLWVTVLFARGMGLGAFGSPNVQPYNFYKLATSGFLMMVVMVILNGDVYETVSQSLYMMLTAPFLYSASQLLGVGESGVSYLITGLPDFTAACSGISDVTETLCKQLAGIDAMLAIGNAVASGITSGIRNAGAYNILSNMDFSIMATVAAVILHVIFYALRAWVALYIALFLARVMLLAIFTPLALLAVPFPFTRSFSYRVICTYIQNGIGMLGYTVGFVIGAGIMAQMLKTLGGFEVTQAVTSHQLLAAFSTQITNGSGGLWTLLGGLFGTLASTGVISVLIANSVSSTAKSLVACGAHEPEPATVGGVLRTVVTTAATVKTMGVLKGGAKAVGDGAAKAGRITPSQGSPTVAK